MRFPTQHCLLEMIEKVWKMENNKEMFAAVFTGLSKNFDCISHELLITKLNTFGFGIKALNFILAFLTNWRQKANIGFNFSDCLNVLFDIPQSSVLRSTLEESKEEVLLGATIDSDLTFKEHVTNICSNQNLHALTRANTSSACSYKSATFS